MTKDKHSKKHMVHHVKHKEHHAHHKKHKKVSKHISTNSWKIIAIVVIVALVALFMWNRSDNPGGQDGYDGDQVKLDFYVMSQCPYGTQVEDAISPVLDILGNGVDFNLDYIASESPDGSFGSLHGQPEVQGNIVQLCAINYYSKDYKYMDMVDCMNKDMQAIPGNWESCAKEAELDVEKIKTCYEGSEGKQLLSESLKKAQAVNAQGSPTIFINDKPYQGARDSLSFQRALCANLDDHPGCADLPKCGADSDCVGEANKIGICKNPGADNAACEYVDPVKVEFTILNDKECSSCNPSEIIQVTKGLFPGVVERYVDVNSEEGKKLVEDLSIQFAPAYIFDKSVTETYSWKNNPRLQGAFDINGEVYKLKDEATGATHFVDEEARKAYFEAIGVTLGDNKPQIDFFVMSYCPYGNQAEEGIEPAYQLLKDSAEFNPRYVIYANYQGGGPNYCIADGKYCSMHGIQELNQNVREICVNNYMGIDKWFEFVLEMNQKCNYKNADTCWEPVATELGLDTEKIKECEQNEGLELIKAEFDLNAKLKVSGSPTIFVDGEPYKGARTPEGYKSALCDAFDSKPGECSTALASGGDTPAPQGQC